MALQREQVVQTAEKYVSRGKIEPAIREYRKLLTENPNDINTLNRIGDLYARIQRIDEAVDFFTQIAEQYTTEGFFVKAIAIYKKIIKLDPTRLEVYEKLAELYHKQGLVNEARTQYQVLADYYHKHDNAASAIAIYQKMADLEPNNPTYHVKLAEIYQQQQLIEKAMGEYRVIAEMMIAHGRSQDAAQVYERALDIDSSNVYFINDAVFKLKESGNTAAVTRFLTIAAERNPQAARIARLAQVEEQEVEAEAVPEVRPEPQAAPRSEGRSVRPDDDDGIGGTAVYGTDLSSVMEAALEAEAAMAPAVEEAEEEAGEIEIKLDLDETFVLDMDDDNEPTSLVKPPPDMAGEGLRLGRAWSAEAAPAPPPATEDFPEIEIELDLGEPEAAPAPPAAAADPFESMALPRMDVTRTGSVYLQLEEPDLPNLDSASWMLQPRAEEPVLELEIEEDEAPSPDIDADFLERTAASLHPRNKAVDRDEDLVSEAEVLAKYGLEDKALERLSEALRIQPHNMAAHAFLVQMHLAKEREGLVLDLANAMARAAGEVRDTQIWPRIRKELMDAGYRVDGDHVLASPSGYAAPAPAKAPPAAPPPPPAPAPVSLGFVELQDADLAGLPTLEALPEVDFPEVDLPDVDLPDVDLPDFQLPDIDLEMETPQAPAVPAPVAPPPVPTAPVAPVATPSEARKRSKDLDQMVEGLLAPKPRRAPVPPPAAAAPPAVSVPLPAPPPPLPEPPAIPVPPPAAVPPGTPATTTGARPVMFNPLEIGEMIEQEDDDFEWAPAGTQDSFPPMPPVPSPPQYPTSGSAPVSAPGTSGMSFLASLDDTSGGSWLDEADRNRSVTSPAGGDSLFDEEDDFFDLAAQLEQELSQEDLFRGGEGLLPQPAEQSLEEIVEGFKKGVAEHLSPTDYDTHFNLGIAYREMGLLDEAIGEFQISAKDPRHLVLCCSMLGLCFLDKGLPELAVKWYQRGLEAPGLSEEDNLGLLYDLGCSYLAMDDKPAAYKSFVDLYGINTNYRDVVARLEELGH